MLLNLTIQNTNYLSMKKAFLEFMTHVMTNDCPFYTYNVSIYKSFIDVVFVISTTINPSDLGWINTHLIGGRWFLAAENDSIRLTIRFDETDDD